MEIRGRTMKIKTEIMRSVVGFWRSHRNLSIVLCALGLILAVVLGQCGCGAVGIADPEVRTAATEVGDLFRAAYDFAEDDRECVGYLSRASDHLLAIMKTYGERLSEEDRDKVIRIMEGGIDVMESIHSKGYVRQRCLSLAAMADSIGRYDHQGMADEFDQAHENYWVEENVPEENSP